MGRVGPGVPGRGPRGAGTTPGALPCRFRLHRTPRPELEEGVDSVDGGGREREKLRTEKNSI